MARAESPEKTAEAIVQLTTAGGPSAAVILYEPAEVQRLRDKVLLAAQRESESGRKQIRAALFGAGPSLDDVQRMTPENLLLAILAKLPARTAKYDEFKALGSVKEGEMLHIVVRASLTKVERLKRRTIVQVVTLLPSGKEWRAAIPSGIESYVDVVLAAAPDDAPAAVPAPAPAAKDPAASALLARGIELLTKGNCLTYFLDVMEPGFSKTMSQKAFDAIVRGCELNDRTREKFRMGLELSQAREPRVENGGLKQVYDLTGEGLPYDKLTLVKIDGRWYVAE
ncbi:MAG: hypothetical protein U1F35_20350 [Steroidobacteraceae bacterium]